MRTLPLAPPERVLPAYLATAAHVDYTSGFHALEPDRFRWIQEEGRLTFEPDAGERYLECNDYRHSH